MLALVLVSSSGHVLSQGLGHSGPVMSLLWFNQLFSQVLRHSAR
jgi:hypothetical protein